LPTCFLADGENDQKKRATAFTPRAAKSIHGRLAMSVGFNSAKPPCHSERHSIQLPNSTIQLPKSKMVNIGRKSFRQRDMLARIENHE
jgi:hypothetical protein